MKNKRKHYPPSRLKYEESHPTIAIRVSKKIKSILEARKKQTGESYANIIKDCLMSTFESDNVRKEGYKEGWKDAEKKYRIWYYCYICNEEMTMYANANDHKALIDYMKKDGWCHKECHDMRKAMKQIQDRDSWRAQ